MALNFQKLRLDSPSDRRFAEESLYAMSIHEHLLGRERELQLNSLPHKAINYVCFNGNFDSAQTLKWGPNAQNRREFTFCPARSTDSHSFKCRVNGRFRFRLIGIDLAGPDQLQNRKESDDNPRSAF